MKEFIGETLGTFILVLFGCGSVAVAKMSGEYYVQPSEILYLLIYSVRISIF